jgi:DNA processing protein
MNKKVYLAALHKIWFTHKKLFYTFDKSNNYKDIYNNLDINYLIKIWYTNKQSENIINKKNKLDIKKFNDYIEKLNIKIIDFFDSEYINNLNNIERKPFLYYLRWELTLPWISFIWSRVISNYWKTVIEKIVPSVWKYFTIISWWAYWCDSYSHKIALNNNVKTISIIWTWIDIDYPISNEVYCLSFQFEKNQIHIIFQ